MKWLDGLVTDFLPLFVRAFDLLIAVGMNREFQQTEAEQKHATVALSTNWKYISSQYVSGLLGKEFFDPF